VVIGSTAVGLGLVLGFHTHPSHASRVSQPTTKTTPKATPTTTPQTRGDAGTASPSTATTRPTSSTPSPVASNKTATGQDIQYRYGDIQLAVTATGTKITNISVLQEGATDGRSQQINGDAVPQLTSEAMTAQSSQIDGVSGATYTSAAYAQSLQSALDQLGIK
jgi:uncharacterized protein with FMN-binding domain